MRISIVTPSYNQAPFIRRTIDSVLAQHGDFELDYKVIDGVSTDGTIEILKSYGDRLTWVSEPDRGQVDAINRGLRAATGDIIGWLNSDDTLMPGALARVADAFAARPEAEWLHGRCEIIDEHDRPVRRWISRYKHYRSQRHTLERFLTENYISQMMTRVLAAQSGMGLDRLPESCDPLRVRLRPVSAARPARRAALHRRADRIIFRWYETSKSGGGFVVQMTGDRDLEIPRRVRRAASYWTRVQALAKKSAIISIYRALGVARTTFQPIALIVLETSLHWFFGQDRELLESARSIAAERVTA